MNHANQGRLFYKRKAIEQANIDVAEALKGLPPDNLVFIPVPPSKHADDPDYDPRVRDMLRLAEDRCGIYVVEALRNLQGRSAAHGETNRPTIADIAANLEVSTLAWTSAKVVAIFDDVLVSGTQFKAAVRVLRQYNATAKYVGVFWVRRTFA